MFKIVDILNGQTVIGQIDRADITTLSQVVEIRDIEFPQYFWLSDEVEFNPNDVVLKTLVEYAQQHGEFIDADDDAIEEVNEKGCYLGFERVDERATYHVSGTIKRGDDDVPVPGLQLKLYDRDVISHDLCGLAFTNDKGYYKIPFNKENFSSPGPIDFEGLPELYLEIAKLDKKSGTLTMIKRLELPQTDETNIVRNVDLKE